jgi:hypothetical protein
MTRAVPQKNPSHRLFIERARCAGN